MIGKWIRSPLEDCVIDGVRIEISRHSKTALIIATSPSVKGCFVHGRTMDQIHYRVPQALKSLAVERREA